MKTLNVHKESNATGIQGLRGRDLVVDVNEIPEVVQVANHYARQGQLETAQQC